MTFFDTIIRSSKKTMVFINIFLKNINKIEPLKHKKGSQHSCEP